MNKEKLIKKLENKEYRDGFVSSIIDIGIPFQIRALRDQRNWKQKDLGKKSKMKQEVISRLENPGYGKLNLKTLKRIASAFDIGLLVRFVPLSDLVKMELNQSSTSLEVLSYKDEPYFQDIAVTDESEIKQYLVKILETYKETSIMVPTINRDELKVSKIGYLINDFFLNDNGGMA